MILEVTCTDYGIVPVIKVIKTIFTMIEILAPVLAILSLTILFGKLMMYPQEKDKKEEKYKQQIKNTIISFVIIFFLPIFVNLVMGITYMKDTFEVAACWDEAEKVSFSSKGEYYEYDRNKNKNKQKIVGEKKYDKGYTGKPIYNKDKNSNNNSNNSENSTDKGGKAGLSKSGKVAYLTKNGKNWNLNSKIGYSLNQGACSDGTYVYVVFKGDDSHARIGKFDFNERRLVKKSGVMNLGHANDITYDPSRNKLFVTNRETNDLSLSMIDPNTFSKSTVKVKIPSSIRGIHAFNGIVYDEDRNQLLIRARYGNSQLVWVNNNFKAVKVLHIRKWFDLPTQGMEKVNNKIIYAQSILQYRSSVSSYSKQNGRKIKSTQLGVHGELEGVFYHNGDLYGITFDTRGDNKSLVYKINSSNY